MTKYKVNQEVEATVERILPFGVFVRLDDGTRAYIRRRELDLDADVEPSQVIHENERIKAVVLGIGEPGKYVEISRRATLKDPWPEFARHYHVGNAVRGTVKSLHSHGVFVRIQAGINGFIPLGELTTTIVDKPEEVLWVGDEIEAVITRIMPDSRRTDLSIKARIKQYDQAFEYSRMVSKKDTGELYESIYVKEENINKIDSALCDRVGPILIVEDDDYVRESLVTWLIQEGFDVSAVKSIPQALDMKSVFYNVFIVDLNLLGDDGLDLIQHLRKRSKKANVCVMSSPDMLDARSDDIETAKVMEVFPKPLDVDEIKRFLLQLARDEYVPFWKASHQVINVPLSIDMSRYSEKQPLDRLQQTLKELVSMSGAQRGVLFQRDPGTQKISVLGQAGEEKINDPAIYSLWESPVKDVIVEGRPVLIAQINEKTLAKYDKLLNLLSFESCIGVPVYIQGEIHHAAFFFHSDRDAFSHYRLRDVQAGALVLSTILMEERIQERLRSLNPMLLSGELAASFGHDVFNKITALELESRNLVNGNESTFRPHSQKILELMLDLKNTVQAFQQILRAKEHVDAIDVNHIIERSKLLLRDLARKEKTQVILKLASNLPVVSGNSTLLQQILLNIMLNAIQQMVLKAGKNKWEGQRALEIVTNLKNGFIQIHCKDNGPGIHKEHLNKIFMPGFSTRDGSGLGLYIARSFLQVLGGKLSVEETLVPLGTTFLLELPVQQETNYE